jgi:hypothetical protein
MSTQGEATQWQAARRTPGKATAALILGILGLVLVPIIPSILAVVFGSGAKHEIDASGGRLEGRGLAVTGLVLGWIALAIWALLLLSIFAF